MCAAVVITRYVWFDYNKNNRTYPDIPVHLPVKMLQESLQELSDLEITHPHFHFLLFRRRFYHKIKKNEWNYLRYLFEDGSAGV